MAYRGFLELFTLFTALTLSGFTIVGHAAWQGSEALNSCVPLALCMDNRARRTGLETRIYAIECGFRRK